MYQRVDTCHHGPMSGDVGVNYSRCLPEICEGAAAGLITLQIQKDRYVETRDSQKA